MNQYPAGWITCHSCTEAWGPTTPVQALVEHSKTWHRRKYYENQYARGPPKDRLGLALFALTQIGRVMPGADRFEPDVPNQPITKHSDRWGWLTTQTGVKHAWEKWPNAAVLMQSTGARS